MFKFLRVFLFLALLPAMGTFHVAAQEVTDVALNTAFTFYFKNANKPFKFTIASSEEQKMEIVGKSRTMKLMDVPVVNSSDPVIPEGTTYITGDLSSDLFYFEVRVEKPELITKIDFSRESEDYAPVTGCDGNSPMTSLEELRGDNNTIESSPFGSNFTNARIVSFKDNPFGSVKYLYMSDFQSLTYLDLSTTKGGAAIGIDWPQEGMSADAYVNLSGHQLFFDDFHNSLIGNPNFHYSPQKFDYGKISSDKTTNVVTVADMGRTIGDNPINVVVRSGNTVLTEGSDYTTKKDDYDLKFYFTRDYPAVTFSATCASFPDLVVTSDPVDVYTAYYQILRFDFTHGGNRDNKNFAFKIASEVEQPMKVQWFNLSNDAFYEYRVTDELTEFSSSLAQTEYSNPYVYVYVANPDKITALDFSRADDNHGWATGFWLYFDYEMKNLQELKGAYSGLKYVEHWANIPYCKRVELQHNLMTSLSFDKPATDDNLYAMEYLDVSYNQLASSTSYNYVTNLKHIDLSHNKINTITQGFKNIVAPEYIDVSYQENHALYNVTWPVLTSLKTLKCDGNSLYFNTLPQPQSLPQDALYTYGDQNWHNADGYQELTTDNHTNMLTLARTYYKYDEDITHAKWQVDGQDVEFKLTPDNQAMRFTFPEGHDNMYGLLTHDRFPGLTVTVGPVSIGQEFKKFAQITLDGSEENGPFTFKVKTDGSDNEVYVYNSTSTSAKPLCGGVCSADGTVFTANLTNRNTLTLYSTNPAGITSLDFSAPESSGGEAATIVRPRIIYIQYTNMPGLEEFICDNQSNFTYVSFYDNNVVYAPALKRISINNTALTDETHFFSSKTNEYPSLEYLSLSGNKIQNVSTLTLSRYPNLKEVNVSGNKLPGIDAGANARLELLDCANNALTSLTLPAAAEQPYALDCSGNKLHFLSLPAPAKVPGSYTYAPQANVDLKFASGSIDVSKVTDDAEHIAVFEGSEGDTQLHAGEDYLVIQQGTSIRIRFTRAHESVRVRFGHTGFAPDFYIWSNPVTGITPVDNSDASVILATNLDNNMPLEVGVSLSGSSSKYPLLVDWGDGEIAIPQPHRQEAKSQSSKDFYGHPSGNVKIFDPDNKLSTIDVSNRHISKLTVTGVSKNLRTIKAQQNVLATADLSMCLATTINLSENFLETVAINPEVEISTLDLSHNRLHFGTLPLPSDKIRTYKYTDQEKVILPTTGYTVTATKYMPTLNGTATTVKWFEADGTEIPATEYEQTADGVFTFKGEHMEMYCEMYNELFPGLTITSKPVSVLDSSLDGYKLAFTMTFPADCIGKDFEYSVSFVGKAMVDRGDGVLSALAHATGGSTLDHGDNIITVTGKNDTDPVVVRVFATEPADVRGIMIPYHGAAKLTDIDVTRLPNLSYLALHGQNLGRTLDLSKNTNLETVFFEMCNLTGLTLGEQENLKYIYVANSFGFTGVDVSRCPALESLAVPANAVESLDLSNNPNLKNLSCGGNRLTALDLSHNPSLQIVDCSNNQLTALDLLYNPELTLLNCSNNQLTALDLTANTKLSTLRCQQNQISTLTINEGQQLSQFICFGNRLYFNTMLDPALLISDKLTEYEWFAQQPVPLNATGNMIPVKQYLPVFAMTDGEQTETCVTTMEVYYQNNGAEALMTEGTDYTFDPEQGIITMLKGYADQNNNIKPVKVRFRNAAFGPKYTASYDSSCDYIDSEWVTYTTETIENQLKPLVRFTVTPGAAAEAGFYLSLQQSSTLVRIDYEGVGGWENATEEHDQDFLATEPTWLPMYNQEKFLIQLPASVDDRTETTVTIWGNENDVNGFRMEHTRQTGREVVGVTTQQSRISIVTLGYNAITDLRRVKANPETLTWLGLAKNKFTEAFSDNITGVYPGHKYFNEYTKLEILDVQDCGLTDMDLTPQQTTLTELFAGENYWRNRTVGENGGLDLRNFNALVLLSVRLCGLTKVDLTANPALESLNVDANYDLSELDLSRNPQLLTLQLNYCDFAEIDLTYNSLLRQYGCRHNRFRFDTLLHPDHLSKSTDLAPSGKVYFNGYEYSDQADLWIDATAGDTGILNAVDVTKYMPTVTGNETAVKWFGNCESTDHAVRDGWQWTNRRIHMVDSVPGDAYAAAFAAYSDLPAKEDSRKTYGPEACWDTPSKAAGYAADDDTYDYGYAANGKYQFAYKTPALRAEFTNPTFPGLTLYTNKVDIAGKTIITGVEDVTVDEAEAEYYTIQGIRMPARSRDELRPGIYIERRGRKVTKILIK